MKIKVLSWNIWCGTHLERVIDFLRNADADIIALQEVSDDERGNLAEFIARRLRYECVHNIDMNLPLKFLPGHKSDDLRVAKFGNAILSKHEIVGSERITLTEEGKRTIIKAEIKIGDAVLDVFSVHLKHTHQEPMALQDKQAELLLGLTTREKTIVMGDFNALPGSDVIKKVSKSLKDTEKSKATPTWSVYKEGCTVCLTDNTVKHKLDYIFTSLDLAVDSFTVHESRSSDHLPISALVEI